MDRQALVRALRDTAQSASNAVASNVSGPVDLIAMGLRGIGLQIPQNPVGGSQWMAERGLTREVEMGAPRIIGETLGMAGPVVVAANAPKIASAINQGAQNLAAPTKLNSQTGAVYVGGPRQEALDIAQRNAAKPISEGGLGLPPNNTPMDRAIALGAVTEKDAAQRAHQFGNIDFQKIPLSDYKGKLIYKSPSFNRVQSSEYRLGDIGGNAVYMRKSNHWGDFSTNVKEGDNIANEIAKIGNLEDDKFARVGNSINKWNLRGGLIDSNMARIKELESSFEGLPVGSAERSNAVLKVADELYKLKNPKKSEAGYVMLNDLIGKVPRKTVVASIDGKPTSVPYFTMSNGVVRSPFAAFDPARINENDLLGRADPTLLGLIGLGTAAGVGGYNYLQRDK